MQSYSAPLNDMKFIIEDFLNSGAEDTLFKQNEIEIEDSMPLGDAWMNQKKTSTAPYLLPLLQYF